MSAQQMLFVTSTACFVMALVLLVMAIRCFVVYDIRGVYADLSGKARRAVAADDMGESPQNPAAHLAREAEQGSCLSADADSIDTEVAPVLDGEDTLVADVQVREPDPSFAITQKLVVIASRDVLSVG